MWSWRNYQSIMLNHAIYRLGGARVAVENVQDLPAPISDELAERSRHIAKLIEQLQDDLREATDDYRRTVLRS